MNAYLASDADLIEINPVALTPEGKLLAADAKVSIDENALFRHKQFDETKDDAAEDEIEAEASRQGIAYVRLGGEIGIMGNGAGLVMCSLDEVNKAGGKPANFLDVGGGASKEKVTAAFKIITADPKVKGILVNIFGGIMKCDVIAEGVLAAVRETNLSVPLVVRLEGTNVELGKKILADSGLPIISGNNMADAAQKVVAAAKGKN